MMDDGLGVAFSHRSIITVIFIPGLPSECQRSVSGDFSWGAVSPSSRGRSCGFGCLRRF